jgi:hypothetical protein
VLGFPIRTPSDHSSVDNSPRTIAASHVLHRLLMPRHPPCALNYLTTNTTKNKMLASTMQHSTHHHTPTHPQPPPHPPPQRFGCVRRPRSRAAPRKHQVSSQDPTACRTQPLRKEVTVFPNNMLCVPPNPTPQPHRDCLRCEDFLRKGVSRPSEPGQHPPTREGSLERR